MCNAARSVRSPGFSRSPAPSARSPGFSRSSPLRAALCGPPKGGTTNGFGLASALFGDKLNAILDELNMRVAA